MRTVLTIAFGLALFGFAAPASADVVSDYHPSAEARTFSTSAGGWTATTNSGGDCQAALNCPTVTNSFQRTGGAGGEGFIRTSVASLASGGGAVTGIWQSPQFTYEGSQGTVPDILTFYLDRRASVSALITAEAGQADYTVDLVNVTAGGAVNIVPTTTLSGAPGWRGIPAVKIDPSQLTLGNVYQFRITSRFAYGATLVPDATSDFDNVVLEARDLGIGNAGRAPGLATALLNASGKKLFIRVRCPKRARPGRCRIKAVAVTAAKHGQLMTRLSKRRVRAGRRPMLVLHVKPRFQNTLRASDRVLVREKITFKHKTHTSVRKLNLLHL